MRPVEGPLSIQEVLHWDDNGSLVVGKHRVSPDDALAIINDLGSHIMEAMVQLSPGDINNLISSVAQLFAGVINGLVNVVAERDSVNGASIQRLPAVAPSELIKLRESHFGAIIIQMKGCLQRSGMSEVDF
jgi:hypothetical protein